MESYGRGIRLTAAAHLLLRHTAILVEQSTRAMAELAAAGSQPGGTVTLCGFSTAATHLLPPVAARLRDQHQEVDVRLIEAEPARCLDLLLAGEADLALDRTSTRLNSSHVAISYAVFCLKKKIATAM